MDLDQAVRGAADLEEALGLPLLGAAPALRRGARAAEALAEPRSALAESFQAVRSALQFSTPDGFPKSLLVTSPWPGTGKTTTAFALAQFVARLGFRVLLVEADLRHPSLDEFMTHDRRFGLTTVLTGAATLQDVVQATPLPNLFLVAAGPPAPSPAELLAGPRLPSLIAEARSSFDAVVFDGPPVMGLADAPIIGAAVEGSILVIDAGRTTQSQVRVAMRRLAMAGAHVLGAVLNRAKAAPGEPSYGYGFTYGYGPVSEESPAGARDRATGQGSVVGCSHASDPAGPKGASPRAGSLVLAEARHPRDLVFGLGTSSSSGKLSSQGKGTPLPASAPPRSAG